MVFVAAPASVAPPAASAETVAIAVSVLRDERGMWVGFLLMVCGLVSRIDGEAGRTCVGT